MSAFRWTYAAMMIPAGLLADRVAVRVLYPAAVVVWSLFGAAAGFVGSVRSVSARMGRRSPLVKGEDWAVALLSFENGVTGVVDISWSTPVPAGRKLTRGCVDPFVAEGDTGTIELDPYQNDALILTRPGGRQESVPVRDGRTRAEAYQDSYAAAQGHFAYCLRSGRGAETEASDNLNTLGAVFAAYAAADRGATVEVP